MNLVNSVNSLSVFLSVFFSPTVLAFLCIFISPDPFQNQPRFNLPTAYELTWDLGARVHAARTVVQLVPFTQWSIRLIPHTGEGKGARYCSLCSQLGPVFSSTRYSWCYVSSSSLPPSLRNAVSSRYTPEERSAFCSPCRHHRCCCCSPVSLLHWSNLHSVGVIWERLPLCLTVSAEPSVHDTHSKDAPWSREHKDNRRGLRAPSDGNVILQAFYRPFPKCRVISVKHLRVIPPSACMTACLHLNPP